jgi:starch phosphorylase
MVSVIPRFNMRRVVVDYARGLYQPAIAQYRRLAGAGFTGARTLADWKQRMRVAWPKVSLKLVSESSRDLPRGERLRLAVAVALNGLAPADVRVEFLARRLLPQADRTPPPLCSYGLAARDGLWRSVLTAAEESPDGETLFALEVEPPECGQFATEIRIYPFHELLSHPFELGLMKWL